MLNKCILTQHFTVFKSGVSAVQSLCELAFAIEMMKYWNKLVQLELLLELPIRAEDSAALWYQIIDFPVAISSMD